MIESAMHHPLEVSGEWFAVYTLSCREKQVSRHFDVQAIDHFLPVSRNRRRWKNGVSVLVERPLFPGYIFVRIPRANRIRVLEVPGVHSIVGTGKDPIALPDFEIEALRRGADALRMEPFPYLNVGERATVLRGPLEGMSGIVVRKKNGLRFVLSLDLIMKSVAVEVEAADLKPCGDGVRSANSAADAKTSSSVPEVVC
jgi:transcription antitermination factor NusG